jgi:hypothetical protein
MDQTASTAQIDLIKAASQSGTVKRFIVSEWGIVHTEAYAHTYFLTSALFQSFCAFNPSRSNENLDLRYINCEKMPSLSFANPD